MAIGRRTKPLNVTLEEKEKLSMLARRPKSAQAIAMRARIVLGCNDGLSNGEVARRLHHGSDGLQMAGAISSEAPRGFTRRTSSGRAALDKRRQSRGGD